MANRHEYKEKDGKEFYALIQTDFSQLDPRFALGDVEFGSSKVAEMYDVKSDTVTKNVLLQLPPNAKLATPPQGETINLDSSESWIDGGTPRYWFTKGNLD